jgi:hypothetical protein
MSLKVCLLVLASFLVTIQGALPHEETFFRSRRRHSRWVLLTFPLSLGGAWLACSSTVIPSERTDPSFSSDSARLRLQHQLQLILLPHDGPVSRRGAAGGGSLRFLGTDDVLLHLWRGSAPMRSTRLGVRRHLPFAGRLYLHRTGWRVPANLAAGSPCETAGATCAAGDAICSCASAGSTWQCKSPASGCPASIGNLGAPCEESLLSCAYGITCINDIVASCRGGVWSWDTPCNG